MCAHVCVSVCSLFLMNGHSFKRICIKFGMWHPYNLQVVMGGLTSTARARGLALCAPGNSELASGRHNGSRASFHSQG